MTIFAVIHYGLLVLVCLRAAYLRWKHGHNEKTFRAIKGALIAVAYCYVVMAFIWPSSDPLYWFALGHAGCATAFLFGGISRVGHWVVLLMCWQFFVDIATIIGFVPLWLFPHINGVTWITFLVLVVMADIDRKWEYEPFGLAVGRAVRRCLFGRSDRAVGDNLQAGAGATEDTAGTGTNEPAPANDKKANPA